MEIDLQLQAGINILFTVVTASIGAYIEIKKGFLSNFISSYLLGLMNLILFSLFKYKNIKFVHFFEKPVEPLYIVFLVLGGVSILYIIFHLVSTKLEKPTVANILSLLIAGLSTYLTYCIFTLHEAH